jgi:hypothetical protein
MAEMETGIKYWLRYIIVPLIGGGGIIAIIVALIPTGDDLKKHSSSKEPQTTQQEQPKPKMQESQLFFASSKSSAHVEKEIVIPAGEHVTLNWDVKSQLHGKLYVIARTISGATEYSDLVNPYDSKTYMPTETTDYYLTDTEGPFKGTTVATLRVTVVH